jgi:hypothetical protein
MFVDFHFNVDFSRFWSDFLLNSPYVPVWAQGVGSHRYVTFIHRENSDCKRLFQWHRFMDFYDQEMPTGKL